MVAAIILVVFCGLALLYAKYPDAKSVRWISSVVLLLMILSPFAYLKWLSLEYQSWERRRDEVCTVSSPLAPCRAFLGFGRESSERRFTKVFWPSGVGAIGRINPGRNNASSDWGIQAKNGVITAVLNLDVERNRPIWEELEPKGY